MAKLTVMVYSLRILILLPLVFFVGCATKPVMMCDYGSPRQFHLSPEKPQAAYPYSGEASVRLLSVHKNGSATLQLIKYGKNFTLTPGKSYYVGQHTAATFTLDSSDPVTDSIVLSCLQVPRNAGDYLDALKLPPESYKAPIRFYGKIIYPSGKPIVNAEAEINVADNGHCGDSRFRRFSDDKGRFSLTGVKGAALVVQITKKGYISTKDKFGRFFRARNIPTDEGYPMPTANHPAIFVMKRAPAN
ncbi:MAG: carboxypeptidase-like regulatory domain-containing protein [Chthoniobacterales bacterium]